MAHRLGVARNFAQTKPGILILGAVALLLVVWMAKGMAAPKMLPCAKSDEEFDTLPKGEREVTFLLPPGCWTRCQLRPTDAQGFQYTANSLVQIEKFYEDGTRQPVLYDPRRGDPDPNFITAIRIRTVGKEPVRFTFLIARR